MMAATKWSIKIFALIWLLTACGEKEANVQQASTAQPIATADIMFNETQMMLANISVGRIEKQEFGETVTVNARVVADKGKMQAISSRVQGRIEKLFIKETGKTIGKGEPVYTIYSESLQVLQREYLLAKEQFENAGSTSNQFESFYKAAERKLSLYGLSKDQIRELGKTKAIKSNVTFYSPVEGLVNNVNVAEGQAVAEGETLFELGNNQALWLEAELFPTEVAFAKPGTVLTAKIPGLEKELKATVFFLSPERTSGSQVTIMRANVDNGNGNLRPGMPAEVSFTHSTSKGFAVPLDAVIRDQHGSHVYVQHGVNTFRPKMVVTGVEDGRKIEIKEGLVEGDTIAITGAYLIYGEYVLKRGEQPMATLTHQHEKH